MCIHDFLSSGSTRVLFAWFLKEDISVNRFLVLSGGESAELGFYINILRYLQHSIKIYGHDSLVLPFLLTKAQNLLKFL